MTRVDGSLTMNLDVVRGAATGGAAVVCGRRSMLRLASVKRLSAPAKYRVLEVRRRRAQIAARHLLDSMDAQETNR
jgi:hypothetical protein